MSIIFSFFYSTSDYSEFVSDVWDIPLFAMSKIGIAFLDLSASFGLNIAIYQTQEYAVPIDALNIALFGGLILYVITSSTVSIAILLVSMVLANNLEAILLV